MALQHGGERFTRWTHVENGQVLNRRLHRIEIQARDGRLHVIQGDKLPDFMQTCAGQGYKGAHIAQILLNPNAPRSTELPEEPKCWPTARDALHAAFGVVGFLFARFFVAVANGEF